MIDPPRCAGGRRAGPSSPRRPPAPPACAGRCPDRRRRRRRDCVCLGPPPLLLLLQLPPRLWKARTCRSVAATMAFAFAAGSGVSVWARAPAAASVVAARPGAFAVTPRYGYVLLWGEEVDGRCGVATVYVVLRQ